MVRIYIEPKGTDRLSQRDAVLSAWYMVCVALALGFVMVCSYA